MTSPSKPSSRRVSAAFAPARLAPTITNVRSFATVAFLPVLRGSAPPVPAKHPQGVARGDEPGVVGAVALDERTLQGAEVSGRLEPRERRLDEAVEVGADRGVSVRAGDLVEAVDVGAEDLDRVGDRVRRADVVGRLMLGEDQAHHAVAGRDALDRLRVEVVVLAAEAVRRV